MDLTKTLKLIAAPLLVGAGVFILIFAAFTATYSFFEYQSYLSSYQTKQQGELKAVQKKTEVILKKVGELLQVTSNRITASKDDPQHIQSILISAPRLYTPQELPNIQSLVYYMLSKPFTTVSRFGVLPSTHSQPSPPQGPLKEATVIFQDDVMISKLPFFNEGKTLKGILEIKITSAEFKAFLGDVRTLSLTYFPSSQDFQVLQKTPFTIYANPPDSFWDFAFENQNRYGIFCCYTLLSFLLFVSCVLYLRLYFQEKYGNKINEITVHLAVAAKEGEEFKEKLTISDQKYKSCSTSFQAYKKLYANLNIEKQEQALQICNGLDAVIQGIKGTKLHYSTAQQFELLQSCLKFARLASEGRILQKRTEEINLTDLTDAVSALFADKMHKSKTTVELTCPDNLCFYGDPLFTELLLVNIIGKAIYRLSRNGKVVITVNDQGETLCFELRYKEFVADDISAEAFKKSFDLFISENILKKMCHENDIQYISLRDKKGFNITKIIIQKFPLEDTGNNLVKLFQ